MAMTRFRFLSCLGAGALALGLPGLALAQGYPERPIKFVIPYAAGGATDILGRLLASGLSEKLGQPVVVENRPGAGTVLAAGQVAKAAPDGYTLLAGASTTLTLNPANSQQPALRPGQQLHTAGPGGRHGPDARLGQRRSLAQPGRARAAADARRGCACRHPGGLRRGRREGSVSGGGK